jgi:hypothetical protein
MMRNQIFGAIGVLWGGAILIYGLFLNNAPVSNNPAYRTGQTAGLLMGGVLFAAGLYYLTKRDNNSQSGK